ncbi:hypothetical protein [Nostoc sp. CMAA1605]|uniref:hypothetical protein n=1 Tax=Nostoc sp. CMAA1605 TaxID=2055159 RepID=UPI001F17AA6B|nr:hypothetical protein [Nostoc sp. CMAA1605]
MGIGDWGLGTGDWGQGRQGRQGRIYFLTHSLLITHYSALSTLSLPHSLLKKKSPEPLEFRARMIYRHDAIYPELGLGQK